MGRVLFSGAGSEAVQNIDTRGVRALSARKCAIRDMADKWAHRREAFIARSSFLKEDEAYLRFLIPPGLDVLDVGCGTGHLLTSLNPGRGVGIDISPRMIEVARAAHAQFEYVLGDAERVETIRNIDGKFDVIVLHDTIGSMEDCQSTLTNLRALCRPDTRLIVAYYNYMWEPVLWLADKLGLRMPVPQTNWLKPDDTANLLSLADFEVVRTDWRQLIPARLLGIGRFINRFVGTLPGIRRLCVRNYIVARPVGLPAEERLTATVIVPCRNECGNIESIIRRIPDFGDDLEILFVEGHSKDGTYEEIERLIPLYGHRDIKLLRQDGKGKGDAVFKAFDAARGDVLMILDADISVAPEDLPKFYNALRSGKGEFVNGSRLVYPMEDQAMRFLNRIANHVFSLLFSWLLNQRFTDTLCGTKVLRKRHYQRIKDNRSYFGDFDPFGDFDLIFGAAKLNLKIQELPVPYAARTYGETQISRFAHGWLLLRMVVFAYFKLKVLA
jgi:SAM-dependent methyltransferase